MSFSRTLKIGAFLLGLAGLLAGCSDTPTNSNGNNNGDGNGFNYDHRKSAGSSAVDFLNKEAFGHLIIELDYIESQKPTQRALDSLKSMLNNRIHKPDGITISISAEPIGTGGQDTYSTSEIRSLEKDHRDRYTSIDTLAAYLLFLDGSYQQNNVLGLAYYNTSMAIMEGKIRENSGGVSQPPRYKIEATVLQHEFGHILGLVANGTPMQSDHKTDNSRHCTVDGCLMQPAVETSDFFANVFDGSIPNFKSKCISDLQANGGK